jgi:hypothetical protein
MDITGGPNDQDPNSWEDGPDEPDPEPCDGCGTENDPGSSVCAGCGFTWHQITAARKSVEGVARALGVDVKDLRAKDHMKFRAAMDAVLGEWVAPE